MSCAFDVIPYEDIQGDWVKLGSGSFGNVYKGQYLGIDVAIKEVLPSTEYDVAKYFEREWRLMKEARHPNVVLYLGLSRAPSPDGRIFIISEFIDNGNVRGYVHDKSKPFPWRLRISFATDIARALAYLHARKCIHRDLKGENLLVTANGRLKVTDFGFARIAARNQDEVKRLTFCGTDSYMSPEILLGNEFDLPTDIFSLGVMLCEIGSRQLADDVHFKRSAPTFGIDEDEVRSRISPGCPPGFIQLCLDCTDVTPENRPTTLEILQRLKDIEANILARPSEEDIHVGSVKFLTGGKRPRVVPRLPSFGARKDKVSADRTAVELHLDEDQESVATSSDDDDFSAAVNALKDVNLNSQSWISSDGSIPNSPPSLYSEYSTTVIKSHPKTTSDYTPPSLSSILTIRPGPKTHGISGVDGQEALVQIGSIMALPEARLTASEIVKPTHSTRTIKSYQTAQSTISLAGATEGGSTIRSINGNYHRFTLLKSGIKRNADGSLTRARPEGSSGWSPLDILFSSGLFGAKCDICHKRLGLKPILDCDDCGLKAHVKCGEVAPRDCGVIPRIEKLACQTLP